MPTRMKTTNPILHVRVNGLSIDFLMSDLDLGPYSDDNTIRRAVAEYLKTPYSALRDHKIDRHPNGNLTLRPHAVFG